MTELYITKATPNPAGKDRTPSHQVTNTQLNGEWLEFQNTTQKTLSLDDVSLLHTTFDGTCRVTGTDILTTFRGPLASGSSIRVHSGAGANVWEGTVYHFFLGRRNFAWNNRCGDVAYLRNLAGQNIDWAKYAPNPGEGAILRRQSGTNDLI